MRVLLFGLMMLAAVGLAYAAPVVVRVAPGDNDAADGLKAPFASLERARDEVRKYKAANVAAVVEIAPGTYPLSQSFELTAGDSGTAEAPVVYRAAKPGTVRLVGGKRVTTWVPVTDAAMLQRLDPAARGKVQQADLRAAGVSNFGKIPNNYVGNVPLLELFCDDRVMTLARWPNVGWWTVWKTADSGARPSPADPKGRPGAFYYHGDRHARWSKPGEVILRGYWMHDWYEEGLRIADINPQEKKITFTAPSGYGLGGGLRRYYAINVCEEIDQPGEWYLDRESGIVYFWPPTPLAKAQVWVSDLATPLVTMKDAAFVELRGLTIEAGQGTGVDISGGHDVKIAQCVIRNLGGDGVSINKATRSGVVGCDLYDIGRVGVNLTGGDRKTLTPGELYADNNHIYRFGRLQRTYAPGVGLYGVGNRATHNFIHDAPHSAILFGGNDHLIELNEMHHLMLETHDAGACYMGRNFTCQGTMIRYNFIHHRGGFGIGSSGVYLDDGNAGNTIFGNVFYKGTWATVLGGSRDTRVENNIFVECEPAVNVDDRAYNHLGTPEQKGQLNGWTLDEVPYQQPPWSTRYPKLANILDDEPGEPKYNVVARNVRVGGTWTCLNRRHPGKPPLEEIIEFKDNWLEGDPKFVDPKNLNFALKPESPVYRKIPGFKRIPFARIGCYQSPDRVEWPLAGAQAARMAPMLPDQITMPPAAPWLKPAPLAALKLTAPVVLDGKEGAGEWPGADQKPVTVEQTPDRMKIPYTVPHSYLRAAYDGDYLYVLLINQTRDEKTLSRGSSWGHDDGVEVCFQDAERKGPIYVIHGFANGKMEPVLDGGATPEQNRALVQGGLQYAAASGDKQWVAEWGVPLKALGLTPAPGLKLLFNVGVRRQAENDWLAWAGTEAQNWRVDKAGELVLK